MAGQCELALEVATGKITGRFVDRHRHSEFLAFLKLVARRYPPRELHVVLDNDGTHNHPAVRDWLDTHPRSSCISPRPRPVG